MTNDKIPAFYFEDPVPDPEHCLKHEQKHDQHSL